MTWWSVHTHSRYSAKDALPTVEAIVDKAASNGYPAIGLTDHGTVGGIAQLYRNARKKQLLPLPGIEAYTHVNRHVRQGWRRYHMGVVATTTLGWRNLVGLNNLAHQQSYGGFPVLDFDNLATLADDGLLDGLSCLTGCMSGTLAAALKSPNPLAADNMLGALTNWFDGRVYVELMNHYIDIPGHEDNLHNQALYGIAQRHGLPIITTSDSHYVDKDDRQYHETLKTLSSWSDNPDDAKFSGHGYWLLTDDEMRARFPDNIHDQAVEGLIDLIDGHDMRVAELDEFRVQVPSVINTGKATPDQVLADRCSKALAELGKGKSYDDRLAEELAVINGAGFAPYMLLVDHICEWMRDVNIFYSARGSASGSLVCWLLGITSVDPIKFKLRFDRFLSGDRLKPPDIDLDVDSERRQEVFDWLDSQFSMRHIGTWSKLGIKDDFGTDKGSLLAKWKQKARKLGKDPESISQRELAQLHGLAKFGVFNNVGVHAAGVVVMDDDATLDRIPVQYVTSSKKMVTAYDGNDIDSMGFVKIDILSLSTLSTVRRCLDDVGITLDDIPRSDAAVYRRIGRGETQSLFQLGGVAQKRGCMELEPSSFGDLTAAMALFRPQLLNNPAGRVYLDSYINRKHKREKVPTMHPVLAEATKDTYGVMLYQEQVMAVCRALGMTADELTDTLKAMKSSNANVAAASRHMDSITGRVTELCQRNGFAQTDITVLLEALQGYKEYGFNRCTTGDTVLLRSSGNQHSRRDITIKEIHDVWHGPKTPARDKYRNPSRGLYVLGRVGDRIGQVRVKDVWVVGVKPVWKVTAADGRHITATANHRHLTADGWKRVDELAVGDQLAVMGECESFSHTTGGKLHIKNGRKAAYAAVKERSGGVCEQADDTCGGRMEVAHLNHNRTDNDLSNLAHLCNRHHKKWDWDTGRRKVRHSRGRAVQFSAVQSIEYAGEQQAYDIEIDSEDHSWVGNGIVTHNSHAVAYARWAFVTGWLAVNHPVQWWAAELAICKSEDMVANIRAAKNDGVKILAPHVNYSQATWSAEPRRNGIRKGLNAIDGIGDKVAAELIAHQPYTSIDDLVTRTSSVVTGGRMWAQHRDLARVNGALEKLATAGALAELPEGEEQK